MAKRVILIVVGVLVLLCGLGGLVVGIGITVLNGRTLDSGFHALSTPTPALVSQSEQVTSSEPGGSSAANVDIVISARSDTPVFLGIARAAQVDAFLNGVAYDEVTDLRLSPYRADLVRHPGTQPAGPPGDESFWAASATGTSPTLTWRVTSGDYRLVIMNENGSPGLNTQTQFGIKVSGVGGIGVGALIFGVLVTAAGIVLIVLGIRSRPTPAAPAGTGAPPYPYGPTGPGYPSGTYPSGPAYPPTYPPPGPPPPTPPADQPPPAGPPPPPTGPPPPPPSRPPPPGPPQPGPLEPPPPAPPNP
jgi:hypothetical protein